MSSVSALTASSSNIKCVGPPKALKDCGSLARTDSGVFLAIRLPDWRAERTMSSRSSVPMPMMMPWILANMCRISARNSTASDFVSCRLNLDSSASPSSANVIEGAMEARSMQVLMIILFTFFALTSGFIEKRAHPLKSIDMFICDARTKIYQLITDHVTETP